MKCSEKLWNKLQKRKVSSNFQTVFWYIENKINGRRSKRLDWVKTEAVRWNLYNKINYREVHVGVTCLWQRIDMHSLNSNPFRKNTKICRNFNIKTVFNTKTYYDQFYLKTSLQTMLKILKKIHLGNSM